MNALEKLMATIEERKGAAPETSYTAKLLAKGHVKCAEKFGEEAIETVSAAVRSKRKEIIRESADMLYHWLTILASHDIPLQEVMDELDSRQGTSGLTEKANRKII